MKRCSGTMTESQYLAWIRSALRSKWLRWPPRAEAYKAAQVAYKGPQARRKYSYKCAICGGLFAQKDTQCDHYPVDAGSILSVADIGAFCNNLYCETSNLRIVCKECHGVHTYASKHGLSFDEAKIEKLVIEWSKKPVKQIVQMMAAHGYTANELSNAAKRRAALTEVFNRNKEQL